jgi:hypothetical protein
VARFSSPSPSHATMSNSNRAPASTQPFFFSTRPYQDPNPSIDYISRPVPIQELNVQRSTTDDGFGGRRSVGVVGEGLAGLWRSKKRDVPLPPPVSSFIPPAVFTIQHPSFDGNKKKIGGCGDATCHFCRAALPQGVRKLLLYIVLFIFPSRLTDGHG